MERNTDTIQGTERLFLVIPCYREEEILNKTLYRLSKKMTELIGKGRISADSRILFVDDGSDDST